MNNYQAQDEGEITFRNEAERELFAEARLGQQAIDFLHSDLGRLLMGYARQEKREAMEQLLHTDSHDHTKIDFYQRKAEVADNFVRWIGEAIQNGSLAEDELMSIEEED